jgi:nitrate reductase alpha subunit
MSWIQDIVDPKTRKWEEFYRNRFELDNIVRRTLGVFFTGSCSWQVGV